MAARLVHTLLLLSALPRPAVTVVDVFAEAQQAVVLPCDQVVPGQRRCDIKWLYRNPKSGAPATPIYFREKQFAEKYQEFSRTENCGLFISPVQMKNAGLYYCRKIDHWDLQLSTASVSLTVVKVAEYVDEDVVERRCRVSSPHSCSDLRLKWLQDGAGPSADGTSSVGFPCEAVLSQPRPQFSRAPSTELSTCELSHRGQKHSFRLRSQPTVLAKVPDVFVGPDTDVVLTCDNVQDGQRQCDRTTWEYKQSPNSEVRPLVTLGKVQTTDTDKISHVSLTEECSLEMKTVTFEHRGGFTCRQFDGSGREVSARLTTLTFVALRLLLINNNEVRLHSVVFTPHGCDALHSRWLYGGRAITAELYLFRLEDACVSIVSFSDTLFESLQKELLTWEVHHRDQKHSFSFTKQPQSDFSSMIYLITIRTFLSHLPVDAVVKDLVLGTTPGPTVDAEVNALVLGTTPGPTGGSRTEGSATEPRANCKKSGRCAVGEWFLVLEAVGWIVIVFAAVIGSIYIRKLCFRCL